MGIDLRNQRLRRLAFHDESKMWNLEERKEREAFREVTSAKQGKSNWQLTNHNNTRAHMTIVSFIIT